jgi:hypothetical protein
MWTIITPEFESLFEEYPFYSQENSKDPIVSAVLSIGNAVWYLTEYDKDSKTAFGLVTWLAEDELWYIYIPELEEIEITREVQIDENGTTMPMTFEVQRDKWFKPAPLTTLLIWEIKYKMRDIFGTNK